MISDDSDFETCEEQNLLRGVILTSKMYGLSSQHKNMLRTSLLVVAIFCLFGWFSPPTIQAQATNSPLPRPTGFVSDYAGVIDLPTKQRLETLLTNLKGRAEIEFAIVVVPTTGDVPIFDYTLSVARGWGIGPGGGEQKGLILLVAVNDRKYQLQVSRHLEGDLPDGVVGEIGRRMRDPFRQNRYGDGLELAAGTIVATLAEKRGFSLEGIDRSQAYRGSSGGTPRRAESGLSFTACCFIIVIVLVLMAIFGRGGKRRGGGGFGGGGSGLMNALLIGSVLNSMSNSGSSSGWGGGGSSGGGGGFGGFGGGGDFGGGGAGGDW